MDYRFDTAAMYTGVHLMGIQHGYVEQGWTYPKHRHPHIEFLYCMSGGFHQTINGRMYELHPGNFMVTKPSVDHEMAAFADTEFFGFHFDLDISDIRMAFQMLSVPVCSFEHVPETMQQVQDWIAHFIETYGPILSETVWRDGVSSVSPSLSSQIKLLSMQTDLLKFICFLLEEVLQDNMSIGTSVTFSGARRANEIASVLESNVTAKIQVQDLARQFNLHRSYLTSQFKAVYGISPREYLTNARIREAKRLLQQTDMRVSEIAEHLNFSSMPHFIRAFQKIVGLSPGRFRQPGDNTPASRKTRSQKHNFCSHRGISRASEPVYNGDKATVYRNVLDYPDYTDEVHKHDG